ncbi:MAG: DUF5671 domain-containing protein [Caldisericota bacterium]|nr:DUF5671 domain-containing protein [Caldisericota bacterium]
MKNKTETLRIFYLYGVGIVTLVMLVFGIIAFTSGVLNLVFLREEAFEWAYSIRSIVRNASLIVVGGFMFLYHWKIISRERHVKKGVKSDE